MKKHGVIDKNVKSNKNRGTFDKVATTAGFTKKANPGGGANAITSSAAHFYSPQLSTDFLELPQNEKEKRAWYRHFSKNDEIVNRALFLKKNIPLAKARLEMPKTEDHDFNEYVLNFFQKMCDRIDLFEMMGQLTHEYNLMGIGYLFLEEAEDKQPFEGLDDEEIEIVKNSLKFEYDTKRPWHDGWDRLIILPPDAVEVKSFPFSDKVEVKLYPPASLANNSQSGASAASEEELEESMPKEILAHLEEHGSIPLDTDPDSGSHLAIFKRGSSGYEEGGESIIDPVMRTLLYRDKLRQSQTSIASRHMTPIRIIWGEDLSLAHVEDLRAQVDLALQDPDYSIVANYEIHWEEVGPNERLMDLSNEYEEMDKRMMLNFGLTSEMLMGEGSYAGNRVNMDILNNEFLAYREEIIKFIEKHVFKPIAKIKGFKKIDKKFGDVEYIYPKLRFTRLALKDNDEVFSNLLDLYSKGSIPVSYILDLFNIDAHSAMEEVKKDLFTVRDSTFNDLIRTTQEMLAEKIANQTDIFEKVLGNGLKEQNLTEIKPPQEEEEVPGRF